MGVAKTVRNMATLKLVLDKRRSKADGTYPILLRIYHERRSLAFPSKIFVQPKHWNEATESVKRTHLEYVHYNSKLQHIKNEAFLKLSELAATHVQGYSYNTLVSYYREDDVAPAPPTRHTLQSFWEEEIQCMNRAHKYGNMRVCKMALDVLKNECNLDIPFEDVNYSFIKSLESSLLHRNLKINTISVYLRALRAIYNQAINKDIVSANSYPFRKFKIKSEKVAPHVLTIEELQRFFQLNLTSKHLLYRTWMIAQLSFLLGGINFTDLCLLNRSNISNGRIIYTRSKTKKMYSVCLLPETRDIIERISLPSTPTLLNILSADDLASPEKLPYIIRDKNKQFNKKLLKLGTLINCTLHIRSYTFRYSIANTCKRLGYDISLISELLGHSYGSNITSGYLIAYDRELLDEMLTKVTRLLSHNGNCVL
jgi:integrase/recombinase XerD